MTKADGSMHTIEETATERDLGIRINNKLKWNDQVAKAKANAYSALSMLKRTFQHWDVRGFNILYTTFVRAHLEYCAQAWNPHLKRQRVIGGGAKARNEACSQSKAVRLLGGNAGAGNNYHGGQKKKM
jgi:hypothetical protein